MDRSQLNIATRPVAHIDLGKLRTNVHIIRSHVPTGHPIMATIKADAYGHGLVEIGAALANDHVEWLAVATGEEALALVQADVTTPILVLTPVLDPKLVATLASHHVRLTVTDGHVLDVYEASGARTALHVHIKVDTGMGRLGWQPTDPELVQTAQRAAKQHTLEGCFTHFARSDEEDGRAATLLQLEKFFDAIDQFARAGITGLLRHAANTAATFAFPETHFDLVRSGIALYGYNPSHDIASQHGTLVPIARVDAPVVSSRRVPAGTPVGYGGSFVAPEAGFLHTVRFGYADGYPRVLRGPSRIDVHGETFPVTGRVCMDQIMFMSGSEIPLGTPVTVFGGPNFTANDLADAAGTVSYEILTSLGNRVERRYVNR